MLIPIADKVLLTAQEDSGLTKSGLYVQTSVKEMTQKFRVEAVSKYLEDSPVKVGDTVLAISQLGIDVKDNGELYKMVSAKEILAIIKE